MKVHLKIWKHFLYCFNVIFNNPVYTKKSGVVEFEGENINDLTTDKIDALKLGLLSQNCYKEYNGDHGAEDPNKSGFSKGESSIIKDMLEINKKKAKSLVM